MLYITNVFYALLWPWAEKIILLFLSVFVFYICKFSSENQAHSVYFYTILIMCIHLSILFSLFKFTPIGRGFSQYFSEHFVMYLITSARESVDDTAFFQLN